MSINNISFVTEDEKERFNRKMLMYEAKWSSEKPRPASFEEWLEDKRREEQRLLLLEYGNYCRQFENVVEKQKYTFILNSLYQR